MKYILAGQQVTPVEHGKFGLTIDYTEPISAISINVDSLTFVNEAVELIRNHINTLSLTEGMPLDFVLNNGKVLNYYIDFTDGFSEYSDEYGVNSYKVKVKKRYSSEIFKTRADGLTFESLASLGVDFEITKKDIPYLIIKDNVRGEAITLSLTFLVMVQATYQAIKDTAFMVAEFIQAIDLAPGHLVGAGIKLAAQLVYTIALIIALIKLAQELRELIFPKVRYFKAQSYKNLIEKGCNYLGYQLQSTVLDTYKDLVVLGVPLLKAKENIFDILENDLNFAFNKAYPTAQDSIPTLGSAIDEFINIINGKLFVFIDANGNKIVRIERRDYSIGNFSPLNVALNIQGIRQNEVQYNTSQLWKRQYLHYLVDSSDIHSMNDFDSTDCEDSTEPISVVNSDLQIIKGFRDVPINFSLGSRKEKLNWIENRLLTIFSVIDLLINALGGNSNLVTNTLNRIGCLQVGSQFFLNTKLLWVSSNGKQPVNYKTIIGARAIEEAFHDINFISNNDYKVIEVANCNISDEDFYNLQYSNYANINGVQNCELLKVEFLDEKQVCSVNYKKPFDWANNVQKKLIN